MLKPRLDVDLPKKVWHTFHSIEIEKNLLQRHILTVCYEN